jgi:hypothetical protein
LISARHPGTLDPMRYCPLAWLALIGCGGGPAAPDARVIDAGELDARPGAPTVVATSPADGATAIAVVPTLSVTFSEAMDPATIEVNTGDDACSGSVQLSTDGFGSCVPMTGPPTTVDDTTFSLSPAEELHSAARYEIRVTTAAADAAGNPLAARFETGAGFTVRFYHHVVIDGDIDFSAITDLFETTSDNAFVFVSHDDDYLYVGLEGSVADPGTGNRYLYFLFSTDPALATGNPRSSDGLVKFGAAGTKRMTYHWRERIDGGDATEFRVGDPSGWTTDWGADGKAVAKTGGYVEARIALSELGDPSRVLVTTYTVDYDANEGDGAIYYLLAGGGGGIPLEPIDAHAYIDLALPTSLPPNHASHLATF